MVAHPALVIEFAESSPNRFLVPDHFLCVTLTPRAAPSTVVTTVALLLSFFVFPPDRTIRGREHEILATEGAIPPPPPVPIDMIVEGVKEDERDKFVRASRLGRPRDTGLENWWKNTVSAVSFGWPHPLCTHSHGPTGITVRRLRRCPHGFTLYIRPGRSCQNFLKRPRCHARIRRPSR